MPISRSTALLAGLAPVLLAACAGSGLAPDMPAGANLAGHWKLDHAASDDPQKVLEQMRTQARKIIARQRAYYGGQARAGVTGVDTPPPGALEGEGPGADELRHSPMAHLIQETVARGDYLTIKESPGSFVLDYGTTVRSFTPGARSVVSVEGGVGDQVSGWKRHDYLITVRAQNGPTVTERYSLSPDGRHVVAKLTIGSAELPAVTLTRQYSSTSESAPRALPSTD